MDEFELIGRCFRERATPSPGTVLGIGDDAAVLDIGDEPLVHARGTTAFSVRDDPSALACRVFGATFIRLAACAVTPRWATLGLTLETNEAEWTEHFAAATAATCQACGVELIGGDTTRGPGRATVFALGTGTPRTPVPSPRPPAAAVRVRLAHGAEGETEHAIADLVSMCANLAGRGAEIQCGDGPELGGGGDSLEFTAHADAAGLDVLRAAVGHGRLAAARVEADG